MSKLLQELGLVPYFIQQLGDVALMDARLGRVTAVQRSRITLVSAEGEQVAELAPGLLRCAALERPTVGDWVVLDESLTRIERVLERKTLFRRVGAGSRQEIQPIAANIDVLFILSSCNEEFKESRLERYLALSVEAGATPVIVLTKADLTDDRDRYIRRARSTHSSVAIEAVNALDSSTFDGLRCWIDTTTTVALAGSSGVGKSTLLNSLAGCALTATGGIREQDKKGRHTTAHRELYRLPAGGLLIDVPGMRELRVAEVEESLGAVFDDIESLAQQCQFADCKHEEEPGCAVQQAIVEKRIDGRRLANYKKLQRENTLATASLAERRAQDRAFAKVVKQGKSVKQKRTRS